MSEDDPLPNRPERSPSPMQAEQRGFLQRVVLMDGIGALFLLVLAGVWLAADALLLIFACILFAVLLYELSGRLQKRLHGSRKLALGLVVLALFALLGAGGWLMAPQISDQADKLAAQVPAAIERLRETLTRYPFLGSLLSDLPPAEQIRRQLASLVPNAGLFFSGVLGAVGNMVIIIFVGIYFAMQPGLYIEGIVTLVPQKRRPRARQVLDELGRTLAKWLVGKSVSMVVVGVVTTVGLALLGVPLALILGIIAGLLDFIPYLGPLMAGVPAVLMAFSHSPALALYTVLLFGGIQLVQGYLVEPLIEQKTVALPPALTIVMQLLFGTLFGLAGVALATPMTAVLTVLVAMLYVQDVLGDPVKTPAER